ncbi:hypothetical protein PAMC26577_36805 [Caballeronia sordidicola]|uniref:Uncharacterized protein n=1 Tax=Caballeronia sordidicola TaxID=196367 RepID=A0A242M7W5_CABSO|nr:hypothetical protein PAMC26577_36805 [Caballeronia sordidicola]
MPHNPRGCEISCAISATCAIVALISVPSKVLHRLPPSAGEHLH